MALRSFKAMRAWCLLLCILAAMSAAPGVSGEVDPSQDIYDYADILTDAEEEELAAVARAQRGKNGISYGILTVKDTGGKSPMAYADDFFDQNLLGVGEGYDGVLLLIDMGGRNIWISTHGKAITELTDRELDSIIGNVSAFLGKGMYKMAGFAFLSSADSLGTPAKPLTTGEKMFAGSLFGVIAGIIIGGIAALIQLVRHFLARSRQPSAEQYMPAGSSNIQDLGTAFVRSYVTSTPIPRSSSKGGRSGGGSSTHRSSGGRTHGGRGGRF